MSSVRRLTSCASTNSVKYANLSLFKLGKCHKVITHFILRCSEASLLRHGAGPGGDGRVRIQQLVRLAGIYAASPVQISHLPCLLTSLYLFLLPFFFRYKHGNPAESSFLRFFLLKKKNKFYGRRHQLALGSAGGDQTNRDRSRCRTDAQSESANELHPSQRVVVV